MVNPLSLDNTPSIVTKIVTRFAETSMNTGFWALAHKELKNMLQERPKQQ